MAVEHPPLQGQLKYGDDISVADLRVGDYLDRPRRLDWENGPVSGRIKKINPKTVVIETVYGAWGGSAGTPMDITLKKSGIDREGNFVGRGNLVYAIDPGKQPSPATAKKTKKRTITLPTGEVVPKLSKAEVARKRDEWLKEIETEMSSKKAKEQGKELWEMTRDSVVWEGYIPDGAGTDRALKGRLARWERIQKEARSENTSIEAVERAIAQEKARIARADSHRDAVAQAVAEGKPVPPEVLRDYPELVDDAARKVIRGEDKRIHFSGPITESLRGTRGIRLAEEETAKKTKAELPKSELMTPTSGIGVLKAVVRQKKDYGSGRKVNIVEYEKDGERYITGTVTRDGQSSAGWYFGKGIEGVQEANRIALLPDKEFSEAEGSDRYAWNKKRQEIEGKAPRKPRAKKTKAEPKDESTQITSGPFKDEYPGAHNLFASTNRADIECQLLERAQEGSLSPYSTIHFSQQQKSILNSMVKAGKIIKQPSLVYSGPGNKYRYLAPGYVYDASGKGMPEEEYRKSLNKEQERYWSPADEPLKKYITHKQLVDAPVAELEAVAASFKPYLGKKVTIWGGGGAPASEAILENVKVKAVKDRDGKPYGHSIEASFSGGDEDILSWFKGGKGSLSLGSWQIRVDRKTAELEQPKVTESDLQSTHDSRSPLSRSMDESRSNLDTIESDDPRTKTWMRDPGSMDIEGIDTPKPAKKARKKPSQSRKTRPASQTTMGRVKR